MGRIGTVGSMVSASELVAELRDVGESSYVRLVADWLDRAGCEHRGTVTRVLTETAGTS